MARYTQQPRFTTCRFDAKCAETGKPIKKGEQMAYYPDGKRCFHPSSKQAAELRGQEFNRANGMANSNW